MISKYYDGLLILTFGLIFAGLLMTLMGIFVPRESFLYWDYWLAVGLPLWIGSTLIISTELKIILEGPDITDAFKFDGSK